MTKRSVLTLLGLLLALTVVVVGGIVGAHFGLGLSSGQTLTLLAWTPLVHGALMFLATHLWVRSCSLTWGDLGFRRPTTRILHLLWQMPLLLIVLVATNAVFLTSVGRAGGVDSGAAFEEVAQEVSVLAALAIFFGVTVAAPVWEEVVFRGVIYSALRERMPLVWVSLITAGMFAVVHVAPLLMPYLFVMGIALALLRAFHGSLWAPIIMHSTINFLASVTVLLVILAA